MTRYLLFLMASAVLAAAAGCGGSDDSDSASSPPSSKVVARVGDVVIDTNEVLRTIPLVAPVNSTNNSGVAHPPQFTDCIAASRAENKGASTAAIRKACRKQYETNRIYAAGYLIKRTWSRLEATRRGIEPSAAVGRKRFLHTARDDLPGRPRAAR